MYNLLLSFAASALAFAITALVLPPVAGIFPALLAFPVVLYLLSRRVARAVEPEMAKIVGMLQERKVAEAKAKLEEIKKKWAPWQVMLAGQIDSQVGLIDYLQMKWDEALPRLEAGKWRNWTALVCIGAIHHRKGAPEKAWESLADAEAAAPKEPLVYLVHAMLRNKSGDRDGALVVLGRGLQALPQNALLKEVQGAIANKKRVDTEKFPETWYQFFPEDAMKLAQMRGRRGPQPAFPVPRFDPRALRGR